MNYSPPTNLVVNAEINTSLYIFLKKKGKNA